MRHRGSQTEGQFHSVYDIVNQSNHLDSLRSHALEMFLNTASTVDCDYDLIN